MPKKLLKDKKVTIFLIIVIILLLTNIFLIIKYCNKHDDTLIIEKNIYNSIDGYDPSTIYYSKISYKQYKKLLTKDDPYTIAIIDNSSSTYNKFMELVNKLSYYKQSNIYVLEVSKLKKKEEIEFYELDERLKVLNSDYIITIRNNKVISVTSFDKEELNNIVNSISKGE